LKIDLVPPYLSADYCLRCQRNYDNKETTVMVRPGPGARSRQNLALTVCLSCVDETGGIDNPVAEGKYKLELRGEGGISWPIYRNDTHSRIWGFLHVASLDNGAYRIGLNQGHPEVWSRNQVESVLLKTAPGVFGYTPNYASYELVEYDNPAGLIKEEEIRIYDLSQPGRFFIPTIQTPPVSVVPS